MVFDLGMGAQLVGVSRYSDFPAAASRLPRVGDAFQLNVERIINLAPDRILAWQGGAPRTLSKLEALGFLVHRQEIKGLSSSVDPTGLSSDRRESIIYRQRPPLYGGGGIGLWRRECIF